MIPFFAYNPLFAYHITAHFQRHSTPIRTPRILSARQASDLSLSITGQALFHQPWCKRVRNGEEARPVAYLPLSRLALFVSSRRRCCIIHASKQRYIDVLGLRSENGRMASADVPHLYSCVSSFHGGFGIGSLRRFCLAT